jgi:stress response protein YsnF
VHSFVTFGILMLPGSDPKELAIPLSTEEAEVTRQSITTGRVTISTVTKARDEQIDELLPSEHAEIERVPIGRLVDAVPSIREEADTIVIPVVEEVLIVERRLFLKEEVRVRRVKTMTRHQQTVTLREQDALITRADGGRNGPPFAKGEDANQAE